MFMENKRSQDTILQRYKNILQKDVENLMFQSYGDLARI